MGTMANSEDPDEMLHKAAAFHQGLHSLLKAILREKKYNIWGKIITRVHTEIEKQNYRTLTGPFQDFFSFFKYSISTQLCIVCFVALRPQSTAMVITDQLCI